MIPNKAIKFVPAAKSAASTGLPTRCFGIRLWVTPLHKRSMNLLEIIKSIDSFDDQGIVFAEPIEEKYSLNSNAEVLILSDDELAMHTDQVANIYCPGKHYFLEIGIINGLVKGMQETGTSNYETICKRVISYAENDA